MCRYLLLCHLYSNLRFSERRYYDSDYYRRWTTIGCNLFGFESLVSSSRGNDFLRNVLHERDSLSLPVFEDTSNCNVTESCLSQAHH